MHISRNKKICDNIYVYAYVRQIVSDYAEKIVHIFYHSGFEHISIKIRLPVSKAER